MSDATTESNASAEEQAFARLRRQFHELLDLDVDSRTHALAELQASEPDLAAELHELLQSMPPETAVEVISGSQLGPYLVGAELGRGGMAVVYSGERNSGDFSQTVALKLLHPGTRSSASLQRFLRERRVLARLEHPNIARLIDAGISADGRLWLAMELVDGADLHSACATLELPLARRVQLLADICDAVAYAHSRLVLHRDLKPANIRVGVDGRPRLLDFGIARLLDETDPQLTATGFQALTPRYAAPEQLRGEVVSTTCDIYALGVILRELCLAGIRKPDPALAAVVERACAAAAADRYASAAALGDDLRDWLAGRNLRSGVGSHRARALRWMSQYRWPLGTTAAVSLALLLGAWSTWHQAELAAQESVRTRAHLNALLEVLGAASPQIYAGRDPPASAFLVEAAQRLQAQPDTDPELLWLSLNQIGNGLINLGQSKSGRRILQDALSALNQAQRLPADIRAGRQLDNLRLLMLSADDSVALPELQELGDQIAHVATLPEAPAEAAIGALAAAAGAFGRIGEFAQGRRLLAQAEQLRAHATLTPEHAEAYWRQRGWLALHARDLAEAERSLTRAVSLMDEQPAQFSDVRRAEGWWLLAALALQQDDAAQAGLWLAKAAPIYQKEYPSGHAELAAFRLMQAQQALLDSQPNLALTRLSELLPVLEQSQTSAKDLHEARWLQAAALAMLGDCAKARHSADAITAPSVPALPNRRYLLERAQHVYAAACAADR